jgi:kumamolisin
MAKQSKSASSRVKVVGSDKAPLKGSKTLGAVGPDIRIEATIHVRRRKQANAAATMRALTAQPLAARQFLSRDQLRDTLGGDPADIAAVEEFAEAHDLDVVQSSIAQRSVRVSGTTADLTKAFGTALKRVQYKGVAYRARSGAITIPGALADIVTAVTGLDNRPQAKPHFHIVDRPAQKLADSKKVAREFAKPNASAAVGPRALTPLEVAKMYEFPTNADGAGQCIAIIELGGGYVRKDLTAYFKKLKISAPKVRSVSILGAHNAPTGNPNSADGEVMLDIEVAGAVAPKALIAVYFAPNTDDGFLGALKAAIHDNVRKPSVISISWGSPEFNWTQQAMTVFDEACQDAAAVGVTVCAAAGDHGSSDVDPNTSRNSADFPASSPFVLGCGGTHLEGNGQISSESVWNNHDGWATGGGVSEVFPKPAYQAHANVPVAANPGGKAGRGVPDVAGDADGDTGYIVRIDGQDTVTGGTSAVAPLWAGLFALINQKLGRPVGFVNPALYALTSASKALRDITVGSNGAYSAQAGWDPCTGLGSPNGIKLLNAL